MGAHTDIPLARRVDYLSASLLRAGRLVARNHWEV
jgi:hypothetical protein